MKIELEDLAKFELTITETQTLMKILKKINDMKNIRKPMWFENLNIFRKKKKPFPQD